MRGPWKHTAEIPVLARRPKIVLLITVYLKDKESAKQKDEAARSIDPSDRGNRNKWEKLPWRCGA